MCILPNVRRTAPYLPRYERSRLAEHACMCRHLVFWWRTFRKSGHNSSCDGVSMRSSSAPDIWISQTCRTYGSRGSITHVRSMSINCVGPHGVNSSGTRTEERRGGHCFPFVCKKSPTESNQIDSAVYISNPACSRDI